MRTHPVGGNPLTGEVGFHGPPGPENPVLLGNHVLEKFIGVQIPNVEIAPVGRRPARVDLGSPTLSKKCLAFFYLAKLEINRRGTPEDQN